MREKLFIDSTKEYIKKDYWAALVLSQPKSFRYIKTVKAKMIIQIY